MRTTAEEKINDLTQKGWWGDKTLRSIFADCRQSATQKEALIDPPNREELVGGTPKRLSFSDIDQLTDQLACLLYQAGLRQDDKLVLQMPNVSEIVLVYLAASRLGLIVSPVAMQYGHFELSHIDQTIEAEAYLAFENFKGDNYGKEQAAIFSDKCRVVILSGDDWINADTPQMREYKDYCAGLDINANDIFTICWTSGTTGRSKGVPRSYNHWLSSTLASEDAIKLKPGAIMLNPFPFINMAAIGGFLFYWLQLGGTMVLHHPFEANVLLSQLQNEQVQYTILPPAVLNQFLIQKEGIKANFDLSKLHILASGSAPLTPEMITGFKDEFDIDVVNIFGSNEGMSILANLTDVPDAKSRAAYFPRFGRPDHEWDNRISKHIQTKLVDIETGEEITEAGQVGECLIKGATVFDGYYNAPADNADAFSEDGYFRSGDLFEITGDKNQYYRFVGRCKSLIVRGGVNISPEELDEVLTTHPAIAEAAVAAYPDEVMGEKICAFIVLLPDQKLGLEDIKTYFETLKLAVFKWPERLEIIEALPRNAMNKVDRKALEDRLKTS